MKQFNLEEYLKNPNKKVVTSDGRSVKIHCTNYVNVYPVIAEIEGSGESHSYTKDGTLLLDVDSSDDLFFASEKHERWINLYKWDNSTRYYVSKPFDSEEEAMEYGRKDDNYLKTLKIEWEE